MATVEPGIEGVELASGELWKDGPPYELFKEMRSKCPVHWSERIDQYPDEAGFWSVTTAEDVHAVSRDWETYSSELGGVTVFAEIFPLELVRAMFIGMDPPKHDRIKALFQRGFTPKRIADHEERIRAITCEVLDRLEGRESCDLVSDVAQPVVSRVISSFMGLSEEEDALWARIMNSALAPDDPELAPGGHRRRARERLPRNVRALPGADRRAPREPHRRPHEHPRPRRGRRREAEETEIVMGFFLLMAAGNDSTKATYCQRDAGADGRPRPAARSWSRTRR